MPRYWFIVECSGAAKVGGGRSRKERTYVQCLREVIFFYTYTNYIRPRAGWEARRCLYYNTEQYRHRTKFDYRLFPITFYKYCFPLPSRIRCLPRKIENRRLFFPFVVNTFCVEKISYQKVRRKNSRFLITTFKLYKHIYIPFYAYNVNSEHLLYRIAWLVLDLVQQLLRHCWWFSCFRLDIRFCLRTEFVGECMHLFFNNCWN